MFMIPFIGHKIYSIFVKQEPTLEPHQIDIFTGKAEVDEWERQNPAPKPKNLWEKIWYTIV
jgi:amino acid transporter